MKLFTCLKFGLLLAPAYAYAANFNSASPVFLLYENFSRTMNTSITVPKRAYESRDEALRLYKKTVMDELNLVEEDLKLLDVSNMRVGIEYKKVYDCENSFKSGGFDLFQISQHRNIKNGCTPYQRDYEKQKAYYNSAHRQRLRAINYQHVLLKGIKKVLHFYHNVSL